MADFVAVLRKTLDGLGETTPEVRARVYDKARATVSAKLAAINPPPPAAVADRQKKALEDAIASVESEYTPAKPAFEDPLEELENVFAALKEGKPIAPAQKPVLPPLAEDDVAEEMASIFTELMEKKPVSHRKNRGRPPEPQAGPGPRYVLVDGKLSSVKKPPLADEAVAQGALHGHLRKQAKTAKRLCASSRNRFPELAGVVEAYANVVDVDIAKLDTVAVWAIGSSLVGFVDAYKSQNVDRTLTEPLEPQVEGVLTGLVRMHGALVLGLEETADLIRRADAFVLDSEKLDAIAPTGNELLDLFSKSRDLVDDQTRQMHQPLADFVDEYGWKTSRVGYTAYQVIENATIALIRHTLGDRLTVVGLVSAATLFPSDAEFVRVAVPILQQHANAMLAFFNHSPELRTYVKWCLEVLEEDRVTRRQ